MGNIFSNHFTTSGTVEAGVGALAEVIARDATPFFIPNWRKHSRVRRSHARIGLGSACTASDEARMLTLKSSDRLYSLLLSSNAGATASDADLGWYITGDANDGALASTNSVDAFSSTAEATDTAHARVEVFAGGDYGFENMGLQVWELINLSDAATYTEDPQIDFDLTFTITTAATVATSIIDLEAFYVAAA